MSSKEKNRWAPGAVALADAARALAAIVFGGRAADTALAPFATHPERSAVRAITLGSVRWYLRLAPAMETLLSRPEGLAEEVRALLIAAAHQIEYSRNPAETSANAAVDAARLLGHPRAAGLVNAVLRRFVAQRTALLAQVDVDRAVRTAHPRWLVEVLQRAWPEQVAALLDANNAHPPMTLRVDISRTTASDYLAELAAAGIAARRVDSAATDDASNPSHPASWAPAAIQLEKPVSVAALPGFKEGRMSVQDAGAQLAALLLDARPGMRVLDACAAPGGKTGYLLERTPDLADLLAIDLDAERLALVRDNLQRLKREARTLAADLRDPQSLSEEKPFDRVLLDAPCSSTGVIRRHPDIKLLRRAEDISPLAATQLRILNTVFDRLAVGGRLIYCTCSVLPEENEAVIARFLKTRPQARALGWPEGLSKPPGLIEKTPGWQLLPGAAAGVDGFYYACLEKTTFET